MAENKKFVLNDKQRLFVNSKARFPAFIGSWGSGKSLCGILKGIQLTETFPNNFGMIVRKKFTDLKNSTLKDFERYTGMKVGIDSKSVKFSNGSEILFSHADDYSKLQNINLGWFMIDQAEEFEDSTAFDYLRGRMRRSEALVHKGMIIANACGHNWVWNKWINNNLPEHSVVESNIEDVRGYIPASTIADWEQLKFDNERMYNRFVLNSHEDYDLEGAFYASLMSDALKEGRLEIDTLYEPSQPVYTFWDLGVKDTTVIWFAQFIKDEIWLIDYYENHSQGMGHYAGIINRKPYVYREHYVPHDARQRIQGIEISTRLEDLRQLLASPVTVVNNHRVEDRIQTVRGVLNKCKFSTKCKDGVEGLNHYKKQKNDNLSTLSKPVFQNTPVHDWASNPADSFGYMAMAYRYQIVINNQMIGYPYPVSNRQQERLSGFDCVDYDPFEGLRRRA